MYRERVIMLFPAIETFSTKKALDIISSVPGWVEEEASFGERVGCGDEMIGVGPFEGENTLCI
jgi:hypothetical protein